MTEWSDQPVTAVYFHIPFCVRKCTYCDFISFPCRDTNRHQAYIQALIKEMSAAAEDLKETSPHLLAPLETLYIGGGTPTVLSTDLLLSFISSVKETFTLSDTYEWTLEANPETIKKGQLRALREAGINRLSLGLQAIQPHLLQLLGRRHTAQDFIISVDEARQAGFENINADLLLGLPMQSLGDVRETVAFVLEQSLPHVSYYSLILEEGTPLSQAAAASRVRLPPDELERRQYHLVRKMLQNQGLSPYEISNSARAGYECRHNLVYWEARPYLGFGVAAHRYVRGLRSSNTESLDDYLFAFDENRAACPPDKEEGAHQIFIPQESVDREEAMREMMLLGLRLDAGVRYDAFILRFGCDLRTVFAHELAELSRRGLILFTKEAVCLSSLGLDLANQVFQAFVR